MTHNVQNGTRKLASISYVDNAHWVTNAYTCTTTHKELQATTVTTNDHRAMNDINNDHRATNDISNDHQAMNDINSDHRATITITGTDDRIAMNAITAHPVFTAPTIGAMVTTDQAITADRILRVISECNVIVTANHQ